MKKLASLFFLCLGGSAGAAELVLSCDVGGGVPKRIDVVRDSQIADTHIYYVRQGGEARPVFGYLDDSRGSDVEIACVGKKRHALVVSGAFTGNFLKGVVLVRNPGTNTAERLDFAEKGRPSLLFLAAGELLAAFQTDGYGESDKKFVVYRHIFGAKVDKEAIGTDRLPASKRFEVIRLGTLAAAK